MILAGLTEALLPFIGRIIICLVVDIFIHLILYFTGHGVLKVFTLGHYPKQNLGRSTNNQHHNHVILVGLITWLVVISLGIYLGS